MDVNEALQRHAQNPNAFPMVTKTVDGIEYMVFGGDQAFLKDTPTSMPVYSKDNEFYSLESLICFLEHQNENHGVYVKQAAASNVRAITRIDRKAVTNYLRGEGPPPTSSSSMASEVFGISLKHLMGGDIGGGIGEGAPEAKKPRMDSEGGVHQMETKKEVEIRALNNDLTKDRIAEMRRKRQKNLEKGIVNIDESLSTLTSAQLPKTRVHRTRENCMQGVRDLSNVLEIISAATRQWDLNEKKEKVAAVHSSIGAGAGGGRSEQQQRSGYSRYAQEAFAHEKTKEIQTEGSFIGSNLTALKQGQPSVYQQKPPSTDSPFRPPTQQPSNSTKPSALTTSSSGKRVSRSPIIIVPSAMNTMINLYNVRDILQNFGFVSVDQRRKETNKKPTDLAIQRQRNGQTYNIRVIDQAEKLGKEDWERVIGVFVMGVGWQFKGWAWGGSPTDIFTHIPAFHLYFDSSKPCAQVQQWNCHKIGISQTKRHMDKAKFQHIWDTIDNFVRKNKPHLAQRLGL